VASTGAVVAPGDVVAMLEASRGPVPLLASIHGRVGGALAGERQSVATGDGVVWIEG
jgi:biotin carboxyl carrier protein